MKHLFAGVAVLCLALTFSAGARAPGAGSDLSVLLGESGVDEDTLTVLSTFKAEATLAGVLAAKQHEVLVCYGALASPQNWNTVVNLGNNLSTQVGTLQSVDDADGVKKAADAL